MKFIALPILLAISFSAKSQPKYDTVKVLAQVYIMSMPGTPSCPMIFAKAWEVRRYSSNPDCGGCGYNIIHVEFLEMNKFNTLSNVYDAREVNWK